MQTRIIDGSSYGEIGKRGIIGVTGPDRPTAEDKIECVETVIKLGDDGWAIAADLTTPIGKLTRRAADAINAPFIDLRQGTMGYTESSINGRGEGDGFF